MSTLLKDHKTVYRKLFGVNDDKKTQSSAKRNIKKYKATLEDAKKAVESTSILLPNEPGYIKVDDGEKTYKLTQAKLVSKVDIGTKKKVINLNLTHGPYMLDYSQNGRYLLLGGEKGQLSLLCMHSLRNFFDISVRETVRDVKILHNHTMLAVAQKKYVHIYDNNGSEVYCLRDRMLNYKLEYLYYHYLLVGIGEFGELSYQDVSTGEIVAKHSTKKGPCRTMCQNKTNAVIHLGHNDGVVTLWTPNMPKAVVKMLTHKGSVTSMDVHNNYMITSGFDGYWKIWDLRNYKEALKMNYIGSTPPSCIKVSQNGIVSVSIGGKVEFYNNLFNQHKVTKPSLYLKHQLPSQNIKSIAFQPFEDICAIGSTYGISTLIIPGSGFANFDSLEQNPYECGKMLKDREVQRLLDKLPPDSITLNKQPIGSYSRELALETPEDDQPHTQNEKTKTKKRTRGKSKTSTVSKISKYNKVFKRRQQAIADRIKSLRRSDKMISREIHEKIIKDMTVDDSQSQCVKGPVKGAALSRYYKKT